MHELITEFLWNIHRNTFAGQNMQSTTAENADAIANISLSKQLFEHTLFTEEFQNNPRKPVLKALVFETLEKFSSISTWLKKQKNETILFTLLVNYRIVKN
jgi:hypothetical protein